MRCAIKIRLLPIIALLVIVVAMTGVPIRAYTAVLVYSYGFAKTVSYARGGHVVLNETSSFTQDDPWVIAYVSAALYTANLTAQWYDSTGQLYYNQTYQEECDTIPCTFLFYLPVANSTAATRLGVWRMDLLAGGFKLYSAYFSIAPIIIEDDYWDFNVTQSAPPRVHGDLTVTIHPNNQSWSSYSRYLPFAVNLTAHESTTNHALNVTTHNNRAIPLVVVDLGGAQSDGYTFVLSFDLNASSVLASLNGWYGGSFAFAWQDEPWERVSWQRNIHPIPEVFNITLPKAATLFDVVPSNVMALDYNVTGGERASISFNATAPPEQGFGWTIIYQDFSYRNSIPPPRQSSVLAGLSLALSQPIPVLPLTLGGFSLWTAVISVFLLTGSELIIPIYATRGVLVDRRRLRIAALIFVAIFIAITAYQLMVASQPLPPK